MTGKYNDVTGKKRDRARIPEAYVPYVRHNGALTRIQAAVFNRAKNAYWVTWMDGKRAWVAIEDVVWQGSIPFPD